MHVAVYLPLVLPLLAAVSTRWLSARLDPRVATWLFTTAAVGLAAASGVALTALAATAVGQIPWLAAIGDWSVRVLRRDDPASLTVALIACVLLAAALTAGGRALVRRLRALADAARTAHRLPVDPVTRVVVLDDPVPDAYALPGFPGRIVVSTGMLDQLDERQQRVLIEHERAHLRCGHHIFVTAAYLAAVTNPLLLPLAAAVRYCTERWADERAAHATGDRRLVARTIGTAALLTHRHSAPPAAALAIATGLTTGVLGRLRRTGPVPRRVAALLTAPPPTRRLLLALALGVLALATVSSLEAAHDVHILFELAEAGTRRTA
ncbi:MAG TPA: M56 family metallopeptidase [Pseudonocardiaceae bacterium]|nr:M56 family metallopeptidase [Pseudonocardiaceae bacterium]